MENGFKILIDRNPEYHWGINIRIGLYRNGQLYMAAPVNLKFNQHHAGEIIKPTLEFDDQDGLQFLDALKLALDEHHGIREGHVEGELKATKAHLADMKSLLWKKMALKINDLAEKPQIEINRR